MNCLNTVFDDMFDLRIISEIFQKKRKACKLHYSKIYLLKVFKDNKSWNRSNQRHAISKLLRGEKQMFKLNDTLCVIEDH